MLKKLLLAAAIVAVSAASFAADIVHIDLNYWCRGNIKLLTKKLPAGVKVSARKNYSNPKFAKICLYSIDVDLAKVQEIDLEFEVVDTGDKTSAKLNPSLSPLKGRTFECVEFEIADEPSAKAPCKITKWTQMGSIDVSAGDKFTIKAKFKKPAAAQSAVSAASFAADIARIDLNYFCRGNLKCLTKLPAGVKVSGRTNYTNPAVKDRDKICYYSIFVDLAKVQEIELEFEVVDTGNLDSAKLNPSLSPLKKQSFDCEEFEIAEEPSDKTPCKITKWTHMGSISVSQGEKFTVKAKFKK